MDLIDFILKYVVEQNVLIFFLIEAKNLSIAVVTVLFFNEKQRKKKCFFAYKIF